MSSNLFVFPLQVTSEITINVFRQLQLAIGGLIRIFEYRIRGFEIHKEDLVVKVLI